MYGYYLFRDTLCFKIHLKNQINLVALVGVVFKSRKRTGRKVLQSQESSMGT